MNSSQTMSASEFRDYMAKGNKGKFTSKPDKTPQIDYLAKMKFTLKHWPKPFPEFVEEFQFHPTRKWRFDIAWPEVKLAIEYEGLQSEKSRHTTLKGYSKDTEKYNEAAKLGWTVFRYTALTRQNMIKDVEEFFKGKKV